MKLGKKSYECPTCNAKFAESRSLKRHFTAVHEGKKDSFECSLCDKKYAQKPTLKQHIALVHEGKKAFECSQCDKEYTQSVVAEHISTWCGPGKIFAL